VLENLGKRIDTVDNKITYLQRKHKHTQRLDTEINIPQMVNDYSTAGSA
jgi:hypothetical protein